MDKDIGLDLTSYLIGTKNSGGGSGGGYDWSNIGYSYDPLTLQEAYSYSKNLYDNWQPTTTLAEKFKGDIDLIYFPQVQLMPADASNVSLMWTFQACTGLLEIPALDLKGAGSCYGMFQSCTNLRFVPAMDVSTVTNGYQMFQTCYSLKSVASLNFANVTSLNSAFYGCTALEDVGVITMPKATNINHMFEQCSSLTNDSLNNIMASLMTCNVSASNKTLRYAGITSAQATICQTLSNWDAFVEAGWSTGY